MSKIIRLMSGNEYVIADEDFIALKQVIKSPINLIELSNGDIINKSCIEKIGEPEKSAYWGGYPLSKDGKSFMRDGQRIYLEPHNFSEIVYKINEKYNNLNNIKLLN